MSRIKIKTKAQNTLFCIMFTLRRSQNYSQWSTPSQNKQAFECLSYPWLAFFFWIRLSSAKRYRRRTENIFMVLTKNTQHTFCIKLTVLFFVCMRLFTWDWNRLLSHRVKRLVNIDLGLEKVVYASVVYSISFTLLSCFKSLGFIFSCRIYCVTVKTIHLQGVKAVKK